VSRSISGLCWCYAVGVRRGDGATIALPGPRGESGLAVLDGDGLGQTVGGGRGACR
jgi:hypothetical protein